MDSVDTQMTISCPVCAEKILKEAKKCRYCGEILDENLKYKAAIDRIQAQGSQSGPSPGVAALLSFFIPGAGQIYSNRVVTGLCWMFFTIIGYFFFIIPGLILHLTCIFEATNIPRKN